ncbi:unnamed protein product [Pseudo-nitzschia multistriata]|uniref:Uncharacterized protein n=1 Tax=Pseudo-nitzschia multistriata TaxID=183589 RepID=A0A448ZNF6_9STRA|nr:unnamed protein product [Pseudo-nitzschia multistriata]
MKFASAAIAAVFAESRMFFVRAQAPVGRYELLPAGDGVGDTPHVKIEDLESFSGNVYIEVSQEKLTSVELELYSAPEGDDKECTEGTLIADGVSVTSPVVVPNDSPYLEGKATSDGVVAAVGFSIADFRSKPLIYTEEGDGKGVAKLCARAALKSDFDYTQEGTEYVSYMDAELTVDIDTTGSFGDFTQTVQLLESSKVLQTETFENIVPVESFLCGDSGVNDGKPLVNKYKVGQDFQVCVRPTADYQKEYKVVGFKNVVCGNDVDLVDENGDATNDLTSISLDVEDSMDENGNAMGERAGAFKGVIVPSYFDDAVDGAIECSGQAVLEYEDPGKTCTYIIPTNEIVLPDHYHIKVGFCVRDAKNARVLYVDYVNGNPTTRFAGSEIFGYFENVGVGDNPPSLNFSGDWPVVEQFWDPSQKQKCLGIGDYLRNSKFMIKEDLENHPRFKYAIQVEKDFDETGSFRVCAYPRPNWERNQWDIYYPLYEAGFRAPEGGFQWQFDMGDPTRLHEELCKEVYISNCEEHPYSDRRLTTSFSTKSRGLQEGSLEEPGDSSFVTTIGLSSEVVDIDDSLTAPAFNVEFSKKLVAVAVTTMVVAMAAI